MVYELKVQFVDTEVVDIIGALKTMLGAEVRRAKYEALDVFLSTRMEEKSHLKMHPRNMHRLHDNLVHVLGYQLLGIYQGLYREREGIHLS
jgi:hypothetical protein